MSAKSRSTCDGAMKDKYKDVCVVCVWGVGGGPMDQHPVLLHVKTNKYFILVLAMSDLIRDNLLILATPSLYIDC